MSTLTLFTRRWISRYDIWIASVWFGIGLLDATQNVFMMRAAGMHHAWGALFVFRFLFWFKWAVFTPAVLRQGVLYAAQQSVGRNFWWMQALACLVIGIISATWSATLEFSLNPWMNSHPSPWQSLWYEHFAGGLLAAMVIYTTLFAIGYGMHARERLVQEQAERVKAQLDALRRQIEPHFLFNTLNTVTGLVREQRNDAAVETIAGLSELLRRVLADSERRLVPLSEELTFLDKYFAIQKMRFGERLQHSVAVPASLLTVSVPSLLLQPLVENAFKHGLSQRARGGTIRIKIGSENAMLAIAIYNDGPPLKPDAATGIGLSNVRERLNALYGDRHTMDIRDSGDGVEIRITIPMNAA